MQRRSFIFNARFDSNINISALLGNLGNVVWSLSFCPAISNRNEKATGGGDCSGFLFLGCNLQRFMKGADDITSFRQFFVCDSRVIIEPGMDGVKVQFKGSCDGTESCIKFLSSTDQGQGRDSYLL